MVGLESTRRRLTLAMAAAMAGLWLAPGWERAARAECRDGACTACKSARWQTRETASFRILNYGCRPVSPETAEACEKLRERLVRTWLPDAEATVWHPKCHLVLHATDAGYLREVGPGGRQTVASALIDRDGGRIVLRRIDVRATHGDWQRGALAHELAHVVLADRFAREPLPRWLDEGIAILADTDEKQRDHERSLHQAVARGAQFRVAELVALADYPPADRWGTFYGQSASLVEYLVAQQGHARFVEFVELALERGYDDALVRVYRFGLAELERNWHRQLTAPAAMETVDSPPAAPGTHSPAAGGSSAG